MTSEHTELPNLFPISFLRTSGSNDEDSKQSGIFANDPGNYYRRPVIAVPPCNLKIWKGQNPHFQSKTDIILLTAPVLLVL